MGCLASKKWAWGLEPNYVNRVKKVRRLEFEAQRCQVQTLGALSLTRCFAFFWFRTQGSFFSIFFSFEVQAHFFKLICIVEFRN